MNFFTARQLAIIGKPITIESWLNSDGKAETYLTHKGGIWYFMNGGTKSLVTSGDSANVSLTDYSSEEWLALDDTTLTTSH